MSIIGTLCVRIDTCILWPKSNCSIAFDRPWSENAWQYFVQHYVNSKFSFVMFYLTTFVICALNKTDAEQAITALLEETEKRNWRVVLPNVRDWTSNIEELNLEDIFSGIHPV